TQAATATLAHNPIDNAYKEDLGAYDVSAKWTSKLNDGKTQVDAVAGFHRGYNYQGSLNSSQEVPYTYYNYERSLYDFADLEGMNTIAKCQDGVPGDPYPKIRNCPVVGYAESGLGYLEKGTKDRQTAVLSVTQRVKALGYHVFKAGVDAELATYDADKEYT